MQVQEQGQVVQQSNESNPPAEASNVAAVNAGEAVHIDDIKTSSESIVKTVTSESNSAMESDSAPGM